MNPERWQQVADIFQSALQRDAAERASFLAEACAGDEELKQEVAALLRSHEGASAQELEPLSLNINTQVGRIFYFMRRYDEAIAQYQKTLEMDPNFVIAHFQLGWAYEKKEMYQEAIAEYEKTISLREQRGAEAGIGGRGGVEARIGRVYALSGKRREAQEVLDELKEMAKQSYVAPLSMAVIYDGFGDKEEAISWLEKAFAEGRTNMGLKVDPTWDSLRPEPRFQDLLRRMGLAQ